MKSAASLVVALGLLTALFSDDVAGTQANASWRDPSPPTAGIGDTGACA